MKAAPFTYHAPRSIDEAAGLLASLENAKILAGGQSLVPMMNFRYVIVDHIVDLGGVGDLRGIAVGDGVTAHRRHDAPARARVFRPRSPRTAR